MQNFKQLTMLAIAITLFICPKLLAFGGGMPWEGPLEQIADSLTGPVARTIGLIAMAMAGITLAMGEAGGVFRRMVQVVFGLSIAFSAATWGMALFG